MPTRNYDAPSLADHKLSISSHPKADANLSSGSGLDLPSLVLHFLNESLTLYSLFMINLGSGFSQSNFFPFKN